MTTEWLKQAFPLKRHSDPGPERPSYSTAVRQVRTAIDDLTAALKYLTSIKGPGGERLAHYHGIKPSVVDEMRRDLNLVSDELGFCGRVWQERHTPSETKSSTVGNALEDEGEGDGS
jgi:hypothetical protein